MITSEKLQSLSQLLPHKEEIIYQGIQARVLRILADTRFRKTKDEIIQEFSDGKKKSLYSAATIEAVLLRLAYEGKIELSFNRFSLPDHDHNKL